MGAHGWSLRRVVFSMPMKQAALVASPFQKGFILVDMEACADLIIEVLGHVRVVSHWVEKPLGIRVLNFAFQSCLRK